MIVAAATLVPLFALAELTSEKIPVYAAWYVVFLMSTVLHEAAHAFAGWKLGDSTARDGGQVTINPLPHIEREPMGMIAVPILSLFLTGYPMGWASAPYDIHWALRYPKRAALMALAGPMANLLLALGAFVALKVGLNSGVFAPAPLDIRDYDQIVAAVEPGYAVGAAKLLSIVLSLNLILFTLNLIPLPPLDGSAIVPLFVSSETAVKFRFYSSQPTFWFIGMMVAWNLFPKIFYPLFERVEYILFSGA